MARSDDLRRAVEMLADRRRILVFTGAGISTDSGIPDFRGPNGIWTKVDPAEFTIERYLSNPETRRRSWQMRAESGSLSAKPNSAHRAIVSLWKSGKMVGCVTQNIDGLHQRAGMPEDAVVELHGNVQRTECLDCGDRMPTSAVLERVERGESDPRCLLCNGILKASVVLFGEVLPPLATDRAFTMAQEADAVLAVGSTLSVFPAAGIPLEVARSGKPMVIVNLGPTEFDDLADARIESGAGKVLPRLVRALR